MESPKINKPLLCLPDLSELEELIYQRLHSKEADEEFKRIEEENKALLDSTKVDTSRLHIRFDI